MTIQPASATVPTIDSTAVLRRVADVLPHLCWIADHAGNRSWFNQRWLAYTGLTLDQAKGWGWHAAIEPADLPAFLESWADCTAAGVEMETAVRIRGADGVGRAFLARAIPLQDDAGVDFWLGTDTDIRRSDEARAHAIEEAHEARETAELLNSMSRALTSELDTEKLTQKITDFATELTAAEYGAFSHNLADEKGESVTSHSFSGSQREAFLSFLAGVSPQIFSAGVVRSEDIARDSRFSGLGETQSPAIRSFLAAPVISRSGQVLGGMFFGHSRRGVFSDLHERIVLGIASQAAVALDNAQLFVGMRSAQRALEQINAQLRSVNADLEQFAYSASHDLQEPMRNVAIYGELLASQYDSAFDDQGRQFLGHVITGTRRLERLVRDLLDYVRAASDEGDSEIGLIDANDAFAKALSNLEGAISKNHAHVHADRLPKVRMRAIHLEQIFQNLIGNAIKYHSDAEPEVQIMAVNNSQGWLFSVIDNGIGIDPNYAELIFGIFKRLHGGEKFPGTGIGLAICRRIIERYRGRIWVESRPGHGSTFSFTVPIAS